MRPHRVPQAVQSRTLADVIAFNAATPAETILFGQDLFEQSQATQGVDDPLCYAAGRTRSQRAAAQANDGMMREHSVDALIAPTRPAWTIDILNGDHFVGGGASRRGTCTR